VALVAEKDHLVFPKDGLNRRDDCIGQVTGGGRDRRRWTASAEARCPAFLGRVPRSGCRAHGRRCTKACVPRTKFTKGDDMQHNFNISKFLLTTAVAVLVSGGATLSPAAEAGSTNSFWDGAGVFTAISSQCAPAWTLPQKLVGVGYRPDLPNNGPETGLTLSTGLYNHYNITLASGTLFGTTFQTVTATHMGGLVQQYTAQARITRHSPATITTTTENVILVGQISNFDNIPGCVVTFDVALVLNQ
jgi:hypothetical protein